MIGDFHLHTNHSDGRLDPVALIDLVAGAGVEICAITDHDITTSYAAAATRARERGLRCVCGIEMTTYYRDRVVHVLGVRIDAKSTALADANETALRVWDRNQCRWVTSLRTSGVSVERDFADHPVRLPVLIERLCLRGVGRGDPLTVHAMFRSFFGSLSPDAYEELPSPQAAADVIRDAGGIALVAHPYPLLEAGLLAQLTSGFDGIEARYGPYDAQQQAALETFANDSNLLVSCGSDYHGYFSSSYKVPPGNVPDALLARLA